MTLSAGGTHLVINGLEPAGGVSIRDPHTGEIRFTAQAALITNIFEGTVKLVGSTFIPHVQQEGVSEALLGQIRARRESDAAAAVMLSLFKWVRSLEQAGVDIIVDNVWTRTAIERLSASEMKDYPRYAISTLAVAQRKLRSSGGDPIALLPHFSQRGGAGGHRVQLKIDQFIQQAIRKATELKEGRIIFSHIVDKTNALIREHNRVHPEEQLAPASSSTVTRRVKTAVSAFEIMARNQGTFVAKKMYRSNAHSRDSAEFCLEVVEYDDIDTGVFLVSPKSKLPWGRGYLTSGIDQKSLVPQGKSLSHEYRSTASALDAIANGLAPKDIRLPEYSNLNHPWIGYGTPGTILLDNARYNKSKSTRKQSALNDLVLALTRPKTPTEKSSTEHFNDCIKNGFCVTLPGWRGRKHDADSVKAGISGAILQINDFKRLFVEWVTGQYLLKPGEDGLSPRERWEREFKHHTPTVRWSPEQLALLRLRPITLKFRASGGLERLCLRYDNALLQELRKRLGHTADVTCFIDRNDLSYMVVADPFTNTQFRVPCTEKPYLYEDITEYQQQLICRMARARGIKNPQLPDLVKSREDLQTLTHQLANSTKMRDRWRAQQTGDLPKSARSFSDTENTQQGSPADDQKSNDPPPKNNRERVVMTELEWEVQQLDEVALDDDNSAWGFA